MTADMSRNFADRDKLFRTVVRQQGRLPTDSEENHAAEIQSWSHDTEFSETIAPLGTPDDGFKIVVPTGVNDSFDILAGSFYLGGARIENPADIDYADQADDNWLTQTGAIAADSRVVVWLEAEERTVTAVQDGELLEPALRGADGAGRTRMCWRVRQAETTAEDCDEALAEALGEDLAELLDPETGEILAPGTLTIGFDPDDVDLDLCKPAIEAGYLGNRNNCYRIKRTRPGFFVWGEDNAAQLYRVTVDPDRRTIRFLTEPRDEHLRPKAGQTVELLRGDVLLPNFERVAEPDGDFFRVTGGYQGGAITVGADVDPAWLAWLPGVPVDPDGDPTIPPHFYLRSWTAGGDPGQPDRAFAVGTAVTLTGTGLTVTFTDDTLEGTWWSCAGRPDAPRRVLPWALQRGMAAHGPRRHVAALAIVDLATGEVHDCRPRFRPLYRIRSCCTVTVGPPGSHQGDTDSIELAIPMLPEEGGTICLLAGEHPANVAMEDLRDIRFSGCPGRTRWVADDGAEPLATLVDCVGIQFGDIVFEAGEAPCIVAGKSAPSDDTIENGGLGVADCTLFAPSGCALIGRSLEGARMVRCRVEAGPFPEALPLASGTSLPGVFLQGSDLLIERCEILAPLGPEEIAAQRALGGIQIGGDSQGVTIRDCLIRDGAGIGVTLGSIAFVTMPRDDFEADPAGAMEEAVGDLAASEAGSVNDGYLAMIAGFRYVMTEAGCIGLEPVPPDPGGENGTVEVPVSEGLVEDVEIRHNRIVAAGSCGIATYPLGAMLALGGAALDAIAVARLEVVDNRILDCMRLEASVPNDLLRLFLPLGGIGLSIATDCLFRGNEIAGNGTAFGGAICGIGITYGEDIRVEANRIERNGAYNRAQVAFGPNSGVNVSLAVGGLAGFSEEEIRKSDRPALILHGNLISQPAGRALRALAIGPVMVDDNRLTGGNPSRLFTGLAETVQEVVGLLPRLQGEIGTVGPVLLDLIIDLAGGDAVNLVNLGLAEDLLTILLLRGRRQQNESAFQWLVVATIVNAALQRQLPPFLQRGGETGFADNQVSLRRPEPRGPAMSLSSILIASLDDVGFADNQYEVEANRVLALFDAVLFGATVRANGNRGQEAALCWRSIYSRALLWDTAGLNQTTSAIDAQGFLGTELIGNRSAF